MTCEACSTTINRGEQVIVCQGFCKKSYHTKCVGLSRDEFVSCLQNPHVFWICTTCSGMLRKIRYRENTQEEFKKFASNAADCSNDSTSSSCDVYSGIAELKREIATIHKTLADLTATRLNASSGIDNGQPLAHSSPTLSEGIKQGCRGAGERRSVVDTKSKFWLFFTRIKNDVTEDEIRSMVSESLGPDRDTLLVKKLVPAWKDVSLLPFISYKVGIDPELKQRALCPSTWPRGISFREFQERLDAWEPDRRM